MSAAAAYLATSSPVALAREVDQLQQADRKTLRNYQRASPTYVEKFRESKLADLPLPEAHAKCCDLAHAHLPKESMLWSRTMQMLSEDDLNIKELQRLPTLSIRR